jgi:hypothetical protein
MTVNTRREREKEREREREQSNKNTTTLFHKKHIVVEKDKGLIKNSREIPENSIW